MPVIEIGGQKFLATEEGEVVRKKTAVSTGFQAQPGQSIVEEDGGRFLIEDIGFEVDTEGKPTDRQFAIPSGKLPTDAAGLPSIRENVVLGAGSTVKDPITGEDRPPTEAEIKASRTEATKDVATSAKFQGKVGRVAGVDTSRLDEVSRQFGAGSLTGIDTLPGEISGKEKVRRARQAAIAKGAPKTRAELAGEIGETDFAEQLGVFTTPEPQPSPKETPEAFALRLASFRQNEAKKAFNELTGLTLGQIEAQKTRNLLNQQRIGPTFEGFDINFKSKADIVKMADDPERAYNKQFDFAVSQLEEDLTKRMNDQIKDETGIALQGKLSKAAREALKADIRTGAQQKFDDDLADAREELDFKLQQAKDSFIENMTDFVTEKITKKGVKEEKSFDELVKEEEDTLAEELFAAATAQGVAMTRAAAKQQAKKMLGFKNLNPTKTEQISELNNLFVSGGMQEGEELDTAFDSLQNYKDATDWLDTVGLSPEEIIRQKAGLLRSINPNRSTESIMAQVNSEATIDNLLKISNGEITDIGSINSILEGATEGQRKNTIAQAKRNKDLDPDVRKHLDELGELIKPSKSVEDLTFPERGIYNDLLDSFDTGGLKAMNDKAFEFLDDISILGIDAGFLRREVTNAYSVAQKDVAGVIIDQSPDIPQEQKQEIKQQAEKAAENIETAEEAAGYWNYISNVFSGAVDAVVDFATTPPGERKATGTEEGALDEEGFRSKIEEVSADIGVSSDDLTVVLGVESAFDLKAKNPDSTASGLMQWTETRAKELGTTTEAIRNMTAEEQLELVKKDLVRFKGRIKDRGDLYMAVFQPAAIGEPDTFVIGSKGGQKNAENIAKINPTIAKNKKVITVADVKAFINSKVPNLSVGAPEAKAKSDLEAILQ